MRYAISLVVFATCAVFAAAGEKKPNIVVILADDLGWGDVSFNGRKEWATPNLDKLATKGTKFTRWYTAGAVCAPSRAVRLHVTPRAAIRSCAVRLHEGTARGYAIDFLLHRDRHCGTDRPGVTCHTPGLV